MSPRTRALYLAFGTLFLSVSVNAEDEPLPPIFAPRLAPVSPAPSITVPSPRANAPISLSMRQALTTASITALAEIPASGAPSFAASGAASVTAGGTVEMPRFYVKALRLTERDVRPPELPLYVFTPLERDDRRMVGGYSLTLFRFRSGDTLELNLVQANGQGADHGRELYRVELGYKKRF